MNAIDFTAEDWPHTWVVERVPNGQAWRIRTRSGVVLETGIRTKAYAEQLTRSGYWVGYWDSWIAERGQA